MDNQHRTTIEMVPDANLSDEWANVEKLRLQKAKEAMKDEDIQQVGDVPYEPM